MPNTRSRAIIQHKKNDTQIKGISQSNEADTKKDATTLISTNPSTSEMEVMRSITNLIQTACNDACVQRSSTNKAITKQFTNAVLKRKTKNNRSKNKTTRIEPSTAKEKSSKVKTSYSKRKAAAMENNYEGIMSPKMSEKLRSQPREHQSSQKSISSAAMHDLILKSATTSQATSNKKSKSN